VIVIDGTLGVVRAAMAPRLAGRLVILTGDADMGRGCITIRPRPALEEWPMAPSSSTASNAAPPSADLAEVIRTEAELEERLVRAREEARRLVESAYTEAGARHSVQERELTASRDSFQAEVERERDRRVAEVRALGEQEAARFDAVTDATVAALADRVVARLLSEAGR
jgi:vacuolar-type H+-ATPase subunit H